MNENELVIQVERRRGYWIDACCSKFLDTPKGMRDAVELATKLKDKLVVDEDTEGKIRIVKREYKESIVWRGDH